ncbi:MAG: hypothetical protein PHT33_05075 [bacterium]|nr:hypothetical protein [bacterium]
MTDQQDREPGGPWADPEDIRKNKVMGVLAYIIFFIPILAARDSRFAMYHANQGLVLFLLAVAVNIVGAVMPFIGPAIVIPLGSLAVVILAIMGIANAVSGRMEPLPYIGGIRVLPVD